MPRMACPKIPQQPQLVCQKATPSDPAGCDGGPGGPTEGDLECLVCREPYSGVRPPKLLGCQHAFCAVCLKLLLCVQDDAWSIPCPLCRKVTAVPGGLVCTLRDQENVLARLARPGLEVPLSPQGLANGVVACRTPQTSVPLSYLGFPLSDEQPAYKPRSSSP